MNRELSVFYGEAVLLVVIDGDEKFECMKVKISQLLETHQFIHEHIGMLQSPIVFLKRTSVTEAYTSYTFEAGA